MPNLNLDVNYFDHIKTVRLIGLLGKGAAELPIRLWCYCGKHRAKDGYLTGFSAQEIEAIVGWWGKAGAMVQAMVQVGFLDKGQSGYKIHDWEEIEGHLAVFHERAKAAAAARWNRSSNAPSNASSIAKQCPNQPYQPEEKPLAPPGVGSRPAKPREARLNPRATGTNPRAQAAKATAAARKYVETPPPEEELMTAADLRRMKATIRKAAKEIPK